MKDEICPVQSEESSERQGSSNIKTILQKHLI